MHACWVTKSLNIILISYTGTVLLYAVREDYLLVNLTLPTSRGIAEFRFRLSAHVKGAAFTSLKIIKAAHLTDTRNADTAARHASDCTQSADIVSIKSRTGKGTFKL